MFHPKIQLQQNKHDTDIVCIFNYSFHIRKINRPWNISKLMLKLLLLELNHMILYLMRAYTIAFASYTFHNIIHTYNM